MARPTSSETRAYVAFLYRDGRVAFWPMIFDAPRSALAHIKAWLGHQRTLPTPDPRAVDKSLGVWVACYVGEQSLQEELRAGAFQRKAA